jgi:hypothetical protein
MTSRRTQAILSTFAVAFALAAGVAPARATPGLETPGTVEPALLARASANGKYADLVATLEAPEDARTYGELRDYGPWGGGSYRGIPDTPRGYWVYVAPRWYVWRTLAPTIPPRAAPSPSTAAPSPPPPSSGQRPEARTMPETRSPHGPQPARDPSLDGPFGPVHRWLQGKPIGMGRSDLDPSLGFMVPLIRPSGGGFLFSALRDDRTEADKERRDRDGARVYVAGKRVPLVVKLDDAGHVEWERSYRKKGFVEYGAGWVAEARNGNFLVMVPSYVHPGRWPVYRFLEVRRSSGEIVWERQLRGSGAHNSPSVNVARLTDRGSLALEGGIYLDEDSSVANHWRGEIAADGRLLVDRSGPMIPRAGDGPVTAVALDDRVRGWLKDASAGLDGTPALRLAYVHALRSDVVLAHRDWHVAPKLGWMIPIVQPSHGGMLMVGVKDDRSPEERLAQRWAPRKTRPVVVKLDAEGRMEWERSLERPEFDAYGGGLALEAPDGSYLVMVPSYVLDTWGAVARFLKLSRSGEVLWERALPVIEASRRSPEVEKVRLSERGTLLVRGFAYVDGTYRKLHLYDGEIDADGRIVVHRIGSVRPKPGSTQVVGPDGESLGEVR